MPEFKINFECNNDLKNMINEINKIRFNLLNNPPCLTLNNNSTNENKKIKRKRKIKKLFSNANI